MICPHCGIAFHAQINLTRVVDRNNNFVIESSTCPVCNETNLFLYHAHKPSGVPISSTSLQRGAPIGLIWPVDSGFSSKYECEFVPEELVDDYNEAQIILPHSAKASAAISRRIIEHVLEEVVPEKKGNLNAMINGLENKEGYPKTLVSKLHGLRKIGNFAAHPKKDSLSSEIIDIEPQEAEFGIDIIDELFDRVYVQPAKQAKILEEIEAKIEAVKKTEN